ncbi:MAG: DUF1624 domain-containing protein [Candidatus Natronoplasma sp.]
MVKENHKRYWEIDFIRGIAIVMMISFHAAFNLYYFADYGLDIDQIGWRILGRSTAVFFLTLVGISLTLSYNRSKDVKSVKELRLKYVVRGVKIFSWGLLVTLFTYIFIGEDFIIFGVLHFIGVSIILAYPLVKYRYIPLILAFVCIISGFLISEIRVSFSWFLWLGFRPYSFSTVDYFPILPWFGVTLIGIFLGNTFYPQGERMTDLPDLKEFFIVRFFSTLGKNSLKIYLLHQPVLLFFLYIIGVIDITFL